MKDQKLGNFPWFFVEQSLRTALWPRRDGLLRPPYVPQFMLAMTLDQMAEIGVALGAGRPELALGILTTLFGGRDWKQQPGEELFSAYDASGTVQAAMGQTAPWTAIADVLGWRANADVLTAEAYVSMKMGQGQKVTMGDRPTVAWSTLQAREFQVSLVVFFTTALLWGFTHPKDASRALKEDCARLAMSLEYAIRAGVDLPPNYQCLSAEEMVEQAALIADAYEGKHRFRFRTCPELLETPQAKQRLGGAPPSPPRYWTRESRVSDAVPRAWLLLNVQGRLAYHYILTMWTAHLRSDAPEEKPAVSPSEVMAHLSAYCRGYLMNVRGMTLPDARLLAMDPQLGPVMDRAANTWAVGVAAAKIDLCDILGRLDYGSPLMQPINEVLDQFTERFSERKPAIVQYLRQIGHPVAEE